MIYRETPAGFQEHEIEYFPDAAGWNDITVAMYIEQREHMRLPTEDFKKCFICGSKLKMFKEPLVVYVSGIGIRFSCRKCYHELHGGNSSEKTVL